MLCELAVPSGVVLLRNPEGVLAIANLEVDVVGGREHSALAPHPPRT